MENKRLGTKPQPGIWWDFDHGELINGVVVRLRSLTSSSMDSVCQIPSSMSLSDAGARGLFT